MAVIVPMALILGSCRATGPFDVDLSLVPTLFPAGATCPGLDVTVSGLDCIRPSGECIVGREVTGLEIHLELIALPEDALGSRVSEFVTEFCTAEAPCAVSEVGSTSFDCSRTSASQCLVRELGRLDAMTEALIGPESLDARGTAMFRLVLVDGSAGCDRRDPACILGCAYTLPLVLGRGPVDATLALDSPGGCGAGVLEVCGGFAGIP